MGSKSKQMVDKDNTAPSIKWEKLMIGPKSIEIRAGGIIYEDVILINYKPIRILGLGYTDKWLQGGVGDVHITGSSIYDESDIVSKSFRVDTMVSKVMPVTGSITVHQVGPCDKRGWYAFLIEFEHHLYKTVPDDRHDSDLMAKTFETWHSDEPCAFEIMSLNHGFNRVRVMKALQWG